jgi:hypothetical protein
MGFYAYANVANFYLLLFGVSGACRFFFGFQLCDGTPAGGASANVMGLSYG